MVPGGGDAGAQLTADDLVEDLVHQEDKEGAKQEEPAEAEEDEGEEIEEAVTVVLCLGVRPLHIVDGIVVPQRGPEVV